MEWDNRPQSSLAQRGRGRVPPGAVPWHRLIPLTEHERSQTYANITSLNLHSSGISCYIQEVVLTYVPRRLNKCLLPHFIPPSNTGKRAAKDLSVPHRSVLPAGSFFRGRNGSTEQRGGKPGISEGMLLPVAPRAGLWEVFSELTSSPAGCQLPSAAISWLKHSLPASCLIKLSTIWLGILKSITEWLVHHLNQHIPLCYESSTYSLNIRAAAKPWQSIKPSLSARF